MIKLAREHCEAFRSLLGPGVKLAPNRTITVATACTGSAADVFVMDALARAYGDEASGFGVKYLFNCDIAPKKREWATRVHDAVAGAEGDALCASKPCSLSKTGDLENEEALCATHGKYCPVPSVDVFICCTSCKDMSRANGEKSWHVLAAAKSTGGSAQTFQGLLRYQDAHRPTIVLFENVDSIEDKVGDFSNMDIVASEWACRGYETQKAMCNSYDFGLPQSRRRLLAMAVLVNANPSITFHDRSVAVTFRTMRALLQVCARTSRCASEYLLGPNDERIEAELLRRQQAGAKLFTYNQERAMRTAEQMGVPWGSFAPPEELKESPWFATLTHEQRDALCFSLRVQPRPCLFRDVNYALGKVRTTTEEEGWHRSFTIVPKQVCMVFRHDAEPRIMHGAEALALSGFPRAYSGVPLDFVHDYSSGFLMDLAGNMVSTPVLLGMAMAAISSLTWRDTNANATEARTAAESETSAALGSLATLSASHEEQQNKRRGLLQRR